LTTAFKEIIGTIKNHDLWVNLAISKLRVRFIRTALGPVWEIIGTMIFLIFITVIWSRLWGRSFFDYFGFLYTGYAIWKIISTTITESTFLFSELYANALRNMKCNPLSFCLGNSLKNIFILFLNLPIVFLITMYNGTLSINGILLLCYYLIIFFITTVCVSFMVGSLCLKFRDLQYSVVVIMQLLFFMTPVIWDPQQISEKGRFFLVDVNIFYHYVEFFRSALLYGKVNMLSVYVVTISSVILLIITYYIYYKIKNKLIFWVT